MSRFTSNTFPSTWKAVNFYRETFIAAFLAASIIVSGCNGGGQTRRPGQLPKTDAANTSDNAKPIASGVEAATPEEPKDPSIEDATEGNTPKPSNALNGLWILGSPCSLMGDVSSGSTKKEIIFNADGTFRWKDMLFSDKDCSISVLKKEISGTYTTAELHGSGQLINLDFEIISMTNSNDSYNPLSGLCAQPAEAGKAISAKKGECNKIVDQLLGKRYSIFKVEGNTLHLGNLVFAEKDRPSSIASTPENIGTRQVDESTD